jgi:hypothetical protein
VFPSLLSPAALSACVVTYLDLSPSLFPALFNYVKKKTRERRATGFLRFHNSSKEKKRRKKNDVLS